MAIVYIPASYFCLNIDCPPPLPLPLARRLREGSVGGRESWRGARGKGARGEGERERGGETDKHILHVCVIWTRESVCFDFSFCFFSLFRSTSLIFVL